jgi:hypothetical protein
MAREASRGKPVLVFCQTWFDGWGAMGGLSALAASGADKLPLPPVNARLTEH